MAHPRNDFTFNPTPKSLYFVESNNKGYSNGLRGAMIVGDSAIGVLRDWMQMNGMDHTCHPLLRSDIASRDGTIAQDLLAVYRVDSPAWEDMLAQGGPIFLDHPDGAEFVTAFDILVKEKEEDADCVCGDDDADEDFDENEDDLEENTEVLRALLQRGFEILHELQEKHARELNNPQRGA